MSETLNLGAGNWGVKDGSLLGYNKENNNFKPLPFDFTRASSATVVNKAGLIETVQSGTPRIDFLGNTNGALKLEPQRTNLVTQSEAFGNSYWTKSGASIQGDQSTAGSEYLQGDDGTMATVGNWSNGGSATVTGGYDSGDVGHTTCLRIEAGDGVNEYAYNLQSNFTTPFVVGNMYRLTGDYKWISKTGDTGAIGTTSSDRLNPFTASVGSWDSFDVYLTAASATALNIYISTAGGAATDEILIDNLSVKEVQGFTSPSADSPLNAFKLVEGTNTGTHICYNAQAGNSKTFSFFAKSSGNQYVAISYDGGTNFNFFDIINGQLGNLADSGRTSKIENYGNGWFRCSLYNGSPTFGATIWMSKDGINTSYTGDGTSGVYIYGAQLEASSYPTSYIPTQGSTVTRNLETSSQTVPSGIIGQTEGVIFMDWIMNHQSNSTLEDVFTLSLSDGTTNNLFVVNNYNNALNVHLKAGTIQFSNSSFSGSDGLRIKLAFAYKVNDFSLVINGTTMATDSSGTVPLLNKINLNAYETALPNDSILVNDFKLYNTRLSNSELATLTTL
jgi:hypothetical protein